MGCINIYATAIFSVVRIDFEEEKWERREIIDPALFHINQIFSL